MLEARNISFRFEPRIPLMETASLAIAPGEVVGLSGPSGCGKSTLGRLLAGHLRPDRGAVRLDGRPLPRSGARPVQYLAQTPVFAMNPRWRIGRILREAHDPSPSLQAMFGVDTAWDDRFPHEMSAGQLHRVSILRALAPGTRFLIADEITSALDALAQAEIWHALLGFAVRRSIGILVVSHDDALLSRVASRQLLFARIAGMSQGTADRLGASAPVSTMRAAC